MDISGRSESKDWIADERGHTYSNCALLVRNPDGRATGYDNFRCSSTEVAREG
jgi:hypothetical protein